MKCAACLRKFSSSLDGSRPPDPRALAHLESCPSCRENWSRVESVHAGLSATRGKAAPPATARLHARIMAAVRREDERGRNPAALPILRPGTALAAAAIVLLIAVAAWRLAPRRPSAYGPLVSGVESGVSTSDVAALMMRAETAATAPPRIMAEQMHRELANFTNDMSRAAAYLLSQLR